MIHSINALGINNTRSIYQSKGEKNTINPTQSFDLVSLVKNNDLGKRYGISDEQRNELKQKYASSNLKIGENTTKEFMEELKKMGIITAEESEFGSYYPSYIDDVEVNVINGISSNKEYNSCDIRESFHAFSLLQKGEIGKANGEKSKNYFEKASATYEKLANIMDYIFY